MIKTLYISLFLLFSIQLAYAQGCSDAGFCTMGAMRPGQNFSRETNFKLRSIGVQYYRGKTNLTPIIDAVTVELNVGIGEKSNLQIKLPYQRVSGNLGSNEGFGDISLSYTRTLLQKSSWDLKGSVGMKIPTGRSRATDDNGLTLPMYYQTTLGSYDVIAGLSLLSKKWLFAVAYQQALTSNQNDFTHGEWVRYPFPEYIKLHNVGVGLRRGIDVMLRAERTFRFANYSFNIGALPIYRITQDRGLILPEGKQKDTTGLALSALGGVTYHFNTSNTVKLVYGHKITDRKVNPDGLTREWVVNVTYEVRF